MIYFELIFVCGVGYASALLPSLPVSLYLLEVPLVENALLSHGVLWALVLRIREPGTWSVHFMDGLFHQCTCSFDAGSSIINLKIW